MRQGAMTLMRRCSARVAFIASIVSCGTDEAKNPCTSDLDVVVYTKPPVGTPTTAGNCTQLSCKEPAEAGDGCLDWHGQLLPAPDGGPAQCTITFVANGTTSSATLDVAYCSGTFNTQVGDGVAHVGAEGIAVGY
jgi:hypothetical protein